MENNALLRIFFLLLATIFFLSLPAQNVSHAGVVRSYTKASVDSVRPRSAVVKKKRSPVTVKNDAVRRKRSVKSKVDSLALQSPQYHLGERVIMRGDSGKDVRSVARILINKLYIDEASLIYTTDGGVLYDGDLVRAVKHFQEFNGLPVDGIIGKDVVKALRKRK